MLIKSSIKSIQRVLLHIIIPIVSLFICQLEVAATELKTAAQYSRPKYIQLQNGEVGGICIEILQALEQAVPEIRFTGTNQFLPFKRLQIELEKGHIDIFLGMRKTHKRSQLYQFIDIPLYTLKYVLAAWERDSSLVTSLDDLRALGNKGKVITVSGAASGRFLENAGGIMIESGARTPNIMVRMLAKQRGRFAFYHNLGMVTALREENLSEQIVILPVSFLTYHHYIAFSKKVPTEVVTQVQDGLLHLIKSGQLAVIQAKYGLDE